jgi:hypothetical protein
MTTFNVYYSGGVVKLYRDTNSNYKILPVNDGASPTPTLTTTPTPTATLTPTPSRSVTSSNFITLAYTAGSWSGTGTAASKYTTSSTFSPRPAGASSELLPFNFTATSDCEFYLKWSHYGANDDNYKPQTTQILINGNPIDTDRIASTETQTQGLISNSVEYPIWLTIGDIVTVRVYREDTTYGPIDTYTNVSAYAVARTASPMTLTKQGGGSPSWSGIGTVGSKYVRAGSTEINNINFNSNSIIFTVKKSGTFYYTAIVSDYPDDNYSIVYLSKNGASPLIGDAFNEGQTGTRSKAVSVGDIITLYSNSNSPLNTNYVSDISAWVE